MILGLTLTAAAAALFAALLSSGLAIRMSARAGVGGSWDRWFRGVFESEIDRMTKGNGTEYYWLMTGASKLGDANFVRDAGIVVSTSLLFAALTSGALAVLLFAMRFHRAVVYGLVALTAIEMFAFARATRATQCGFAEAPASRPLSPRFAMSIFLNMRALTAECCRACATGSRFSCRAASRASGRCAGVSRAAGSRRR